MANITPDIDDPEAQNKAYDPESVKNLETSAAQDQKDAFERDFGGENYNKDSPTSGSETLAQKEADGQPGGIVNNFTGKGKKSNAVFSVTNLKKRGPLAGIILTAVGGAIGVGSLLSPGFLLVQLKEIFTDRADTASSALTVRTKLMLKLKINTIKNGFEFSDDSGSCNIRCKFGTMDNKLVKSFKALGFEVEAKDSKIPGRSIISSLTLPPNPDGTPGEKITNAADFDAAFKSTDRLALLNRVINFRSSFYLNSAFHGLLQRLGISKAAQVKGNSEAEVEASERIAEGLDPEEAPPGESTPGEGTTEPASGDAELDQKVGTQRAAGLSESMRGTASKIGGAGSKVSNIVGAVCSAYDVGKAITLADKVVKLTALVAFTWVILNTADQIMAGDSPQPAVTDGIGNQLTTVQTNKTNSDGTANVYYNKTVTDSAGYGMAARNDNPGTLSPQQLKFAISAVGAIAIVSFVVSWLGQSKSAQTTVLRAACNQGTQLATTAAVCAAEEAASTVVPAIGNAVSAVLCVAENIASGAIVGKALEPVVEGVVKDAVIADAPDIAGIVGGEAGDAMYSGTSTIFGDAAYSYGMEPAVSAAQVAQYSVDTEGVNQQATEVARYDAQGTPFDINNQYSFLGSIASNLNLVGLIGSPITSQLNTIASIIPHSFGSLLSSANAESTSATDASQLAAQYSNCTDQGITSIGATCDAFGTTRPVMSSQEMNADIGTTLDTMLDGGGSVSSPQIDSDGNPLPNSDYAMYTKYCANRTDPLGETSVSIQDFDNFDTYDWATGANCVDKSNSTEAAATTSDSSFANSTPSELSVFHTYTMDKAVNDTLDDLDSDGIDNADTGDDSSAYVPTTTNPVVAILNMFTPSPSAAKSSSATISKVTSSRLSSQFVASVNPRVQSDNPQRYQVAWVG